MSSSFLSKKTILFFWAFTRTKKILLKASIIDYGFAAGDVICKRSLASMKIDTTADFYATVSTDVETDVETKWYLALVLKKCLTLIAIIRHYSFLIAIRWFQNVISPRQIDPNNLPDQYSLKNTKPCRSIQKPLPGIKVSEGIVAKSHQFCIYNTPMHKAIQVPVMNKQLM